ncbi:MAG: phosphodiester glycosidase family protein, partial [Candidatus Baltobacteraceae bacterium]
MTLFFATLLALLLPVRIDPSPPFPHVLQEAPTVESIAPGIEYGEYQLVTDAGPLSVHVVAVEPRRTDVRVGSVLAQGSLVSRGETIGSMARRTGAVAGINGDYFDIGNTNRPENIVVSGGTLLSLPYKRYAIAITRDGIPHIAEFTFSGELVIDQRTMQLDGIDQMPPPNGGLSLLTPEYGRVRPQENVTLVSLAPLDGTPPLARYRVTGVADNLSTQPPGYYAAIGPNDYGVINVPEANAIVTATGDLSPVPLASIAAAIGGGPLILHNGAWYDDNDGPNGREFAKRIPASGVAIAPNGRLFLIEVDGRQADISVGLKRPEFAALMRSLGATEGLALDGGGSSTLVARQLGESDSEVTNSPSDGIERPVADGLFVYSTAPVGPPARLVALPGT